MATSRKDSRKALAALLQTALVGTGKPAQAVYDYLPVEFTSSPVVCVVSSGTKALRRGIGQTKALLTFRISILTFSAVGDTTAGWTPAEEQDLADDIEAAIRAVVIANPTNAAWKDLQLLDEFSSVNATKVNNLPYDMEEIVVEVMQHDN